MTVFYRGPCVHVTHEVFEARRPNHSRFMIREIRYPCVSRRPNDPTARDPGQLKTLSAGVAGVAAVAAAVGGPALTAASMPPIATAGFVGILILAVASSFAFAACVRIRTRHVHELWAVYRGQLVCLFETTDERTFGQVRRALLRAVEQSGGAEADDT